MDRRKFMLGACAAALAPAVAGAAPAAPVVIGQTFSGQPMRYGGIVRTRLPAALWRRLNYGTPDAPSYFTGVEVEW